MCKPYSNPFEPFLASDDLNSERIWKKSYYKFVSSCPEVSNAARNFALAVQEIN